MPKPALKITDIVGIQKRDTIVQNMLKELEQNLIKEGKKNPKENSRYLTVKKRLDKHSNGATFYKIKYTELREYQRLMRKVSQDLKRPLSEIDPRFDYNNQGAQLEKQSKSPANYFFMEHSKELLEYAHQLTSFIKEQKKSEAKTTTEKFYQTINNEADNLYKDVSFNLNTKISPDRDSLTPGEIGYSLPASEKALLDELIIFLKNADHKMKPEHYAAAGLGTLFSKMPASNQIQDSTNIDPKFLIDVIELAHEKAIKNLPNRQKLEYYQNLSLMLNNIKNAGSDKINKVQLNVLINAVDLELKKLNPSQTHKKTSSHAVRSPTSKVVKATDFDIDKHLTTLHKKEDAQLQHLVKQASHSFKALQVGLYSQLEIKGIPLKEVKSGEKLAPSVSDMISTSDQISYMVVNDILNAYSRDNQKAVARFYFQLMEESIKNHDFQTAMSIHSAFGNVAVFNLNNRGGNYLLNSKQLKRHQELSDKLLTTDGLNKVYEIMKKNNINFVPFLGASLSSLVRSTSGYTPLTQLISRGQVVDRIEQIKSIGDKTNLNKVTLLMNRIKKTNYNEDKVDARLNEILPKKYADENKRKKVKKQVDRKLREINPKKDEFKQYQALIKKAEQKYSKYTSVPKLDLDITKGKREIFEQNKEYCLEYANRIQNPPVKNKTSINITRWIRDEHLDKMKDMSVYKFNRYVALIKKAEQKYLKYTTVPKLDLDITKGKREVFEQNQDYCLNYANRIQNPTQVETKTPINIIRWIKEEHRNGIEDMPTFKLKQGEGNVVVKQNIQTNTSDSPVFLPSKNTQVITSQDKPDEPRNEPQNNNAPKLKKK